MDEAVNEHCLQCPDCGLWFDCRDLEAVFAHEHWMPEMPVVSCTHVMKRDKIWEFYRKEGGSIITIKIFSEKPESPSD